MTSNNPNIASSDDPAKLWIAGDTYQTLVTQKGGVEEVDNESEHTLPLPTQ